ncbi:MAG: cytochrome c peroxidase [Brumimicrobium sp.]
MKTTGNRIIKVFFLIVIIFVTLPSCKKGKITPVDTNNPNPGGGVNNPYVPTEPYNPTNFYIPYSYLFLERLSPMQIPTDNPMTEEGVALGRKLFYDNILSGSNNMSCASCHNPQKAFSDSPNALTTVAGSSTTRNSPAIINSGWATRLFFDGRATYPALENQAYQPVTNPDEMHSLSWVEVVNKLSQTTDYPELFYKAFGIVTIDSTYVVKALAQFERTLISDNSRMDKYLAGQGTLNADELAGLDLFLSEVGDCFHCHGGPGNPLWTDNNFYDIGLDPVYTDLGLGAITGNPSDNGKFKVPTLRNLIFTGPYMHDGRFETLEEVIEFYSTGINNTPNLDPNIAWRVNQGGANFTQEQKDQLLAFLKTLTDSTFINKPEFQAP